MDKRPLRTITPPFVVAEPTGVSIHDRLKHLTPEDEQVLWEVGNYLASLAGQDLRRHCQDGLSSDKHRWAERARELRPLSSARWASTITRHTHQQWALARRGQQQRIDKLKAEIAILERRLSLPLRAKGTRYEPGGYKTPHEWWTKSRRLATLKDRRANLDKDRVAGKVSIVRGAKRLAKNRHNLEAAGLTKPEWRLKWEAARLFLAATGEKGVNFGNLSIRVTDTGQLSLRLPTPLSHLANAPHNRYVLTGKVRFTHRTQEWQDRIVAELPVAYKIRFSFEQRRWYVTGSWARPEVKALPIDEALKKGCIGVDTNHDHLAAWRLDSHGNPAGEPQRFQMDLTGSSDRRDAQIRHADRKSVV